MELPLLTHAVDQLPDKSILRLGTQNTPHPYLFFLRTSPWKNHILVVRGPAPALRASPRHYIFGRNALPRGYISATEKEILKFYTGGCKPRGNCARLILLRPESHSETHSPCGQYTGGEQPGSETAARPGSINEDIMLAEHDAGCVCVTLHSPGRMKQSWNRSGFFCRHQFHSMARDR